MSKELSKTEFDADFNKLLESGDRHACAMCRNYIINTMKLRGKAKSLAIQIDESRRYAVREIGLAKTEKIVLIILSWVAVVLGSLLAISDFRSGRYAMAIIETIIVISFLTDAIRSTIESAYFGALKKTMETADIEIAIQNFGGDEDSELYWDIFKQISSDKEEILNAKKTALDEVLGF